jgi:putative membrane protein
MSLAPRAFRLDRTAEKQVVITPEPSDAIEAADGVPAIAPARRGPPWLAILLSALAGLVTLAIGLGLERLVADLFQAAPWLGWLAAGLGFVAATAFLALVGREAIGVYRERRIERLRRDAAEALALRDHEAAKAVARQLATMYRARQGGRAAAELDALEGEILDAEDRLAVAERLLLVPLDLLAKRAVADAAKQVSVVTALSPRAIVDVAFVVFAAMRLLRRLARLYGARPGFFGFLRLARTALNHLAVTGGVAVGDSLLQQVLGLGLAARISAKLGEGVLNGLMTARFGLAALSVRPLPFIRENPPRLADVAGGLLPLPERAGEAERSL